MWGAPLFIFVILLTTTIDFLLVQKMHAAESEKSRKAWLIAALTGNLALLFYFKYCNFFIENVNAVLSLFGNSQIPLLHVVLPIGISFYTFESLTYSIDVYRRVHVPLKNFWDYQLYILFFPKLIAGPIVRYHEIADQLKERVHSHEKFLQGFLRFSIGLAKKVLIANTLANYADDAFAVPEEQLNTTIAWVGMISYTFQIYFDFSGYSDMALGLAQIFGFNLPENFDSPYSSKSITEYWRRWHMSLGRWMRNYLYIPLGGNRSTAEIRVYINLLIVFFASGLWHGASWTFVVWGLYHGLFLVLERSFLLKYLQKLPSIISVLYAFMIVAVGFIFFRADNFAYAVEMSSKLFSFEFGELRFPVDVQYIVYLLLAIIFSLFVLFPPFEKLKQKVYAENGMQLGTASTVAISCILFTYTLAALASHNFNPFIYFRF